jgi:hypothetical protein
MKMSKTYSNQQLGSGDFIKDSYTRINQNSNDLNVDLTFLFNKKESFILAVSDETTNLTVGISKITFRLPYTFTLLDVKASVAIAPTGSGIEVNIKKNGISILSTKLTIDGSQRTSKTAAVPAVISDSNLLDDSEITIDIDSIGSIFAGAGLKVTLIGRGN